MAVQWELLDNKDGIKIQNSPLKFPLTATNFGKETVTCSDKGELFKHLVCRDNYSVIKQILAARIHPKQFIDPKWELVISHFMRKNRYGMAFIYPKGIEEIPNIVLESFDIIQNEIDKKMQFEYDKARTNK